MTASTDALEGAAPRNLLWAALPLPPLLHPPTLVIPSRLEAEDAQDTKL